MDYKKIFKSRSIRVKVLRCFEFVPDSLMIKLQYYIKTGRMLNLKNPKRFTEKLQWYKLYYRDPIMAKCVDKYTVRNYVKKCGLDDILIPIIGVYNKVNDIPFDSLPKCFVIKDTLGSGGNSVLICSDKATVDQNSIRTTVESWVSTPKGKHPGREWVYDGRKSRILVEEYIETNDVGGLTDYKFFCFDGKVKYVYGITNRNLGNGAELGIYDRNFNLLPYYRTDERVLSVDIPKPENYYKMIEIAEKLSSRFPHARIDLYNTNGKILFGEITFFDGSGYMKFSPDVFDYMMGDEFVLRRYKKR